MVINICRELHYSIPFNEISTAHRLKSHPNRTGPPGIIVRFKDKDIRKDVLNLKHQLRGKTFWRCYGIRRLYINEQLTPDKRRLMYQTKLFIREMDRIHGKISVWTFKGNIFIRKDCVNAPKRRISSLEDLDNIKKGTLSLDPEEITGSVEQLPQAHQTQRGRPVRRAWGRGRGQPPFRQSFQYDSRPIYTQNRYYPLMQAFE